MEKISDSLYQWKKKKRIKIVLTVALPSKDRENIIWLALESLLNQKKIDFGWELLIWEEGAKSKSIISRFCGKLPGCQRILLKNVNPVKDTIYKTGRFKNKVLLIDKWIDMAKHAYSTSKIFVLQATDVYSPRYRLHIHQHHFINIDCYWSCQPRGIFFNAQTKQKILYDGYKHDGKSINRKFMVKTHLNMAMRMKDILRIKPIKQNKSIDNYLWTCVRGLNKLDITKKKHVFTDDEVLNHNWKSGIDVHLGTNNISNRQTFFDHPEGTPMFVPYQSKILRTTYDYIDMSKYVPFYVLDFLNKMTV
jgi:hypothetical protein